jgi:hypothetical protein
MHAQRPTTHTIRPLLLAWFGIATLSVILIGCDAQASTLQGKPPASSGPSRSAPKAQPSADTSAGSIAFGIGLRGKSLVRQTSKIGKSSNLAWVAHFGAVAEASTVGVELVQVSGPGIHPEMVWSAKVRVPAGSRSATGMLTARAMNRARVRLGATFELLYRSASRVIARGELVRLTCNNCSSSGFTY